jgi:hypothetical protein
MQHLRNRGKVDARFCSGCGATLILPKTDETMLDLRTAMSGGR